MSSATEQGRNEMAGFRSELGACFSLIRSSSRQTLAGRDSLSLRLYPTNQSKKPFGPPQSRSDLSLPLSLAVGSASPFPFLLPEQVRRRLVALSTPVASQKLPCSSRIPASTSIPVSQPEPKRQSPSSFVGLPSPKPHPRLVYLYFPSPPASPPSPLGCFHFLVRGNSGVNVFHEMWMINCIEVTFLWKPLSSMANRMYNRICSSIGLLVPTITLSFGIVRSYPLYSNPASRILSETHRFLATTVGQVSLSIFGSCIIPSSVYSRFGVP
ncbi:hypothetical protein M5K25_020038 [Dendrobium thyrsiflorum]|uniref:Uncharacterized protein n=1 Tax=Dendrobium thyrsiflorum TaxID=117978 RepID=A0ABD0UFN4_DENTH